VILRSPQSGDRTNDIDTVKDVARPRKANPILPDLRHAVTEVLELACSRILSANWGRFAPVTALPIGAQRGTIQL
jgi:hypothetical protein